MNAVTAFELAIIDHCNLLSQCTAAHFITIMTATVLLVTFEIQQFFMSS